METGGFLAIWATIIDQFVYLHDRNHDSNYDSNY
jgi:hypothetical protein